MKLMIRIDYEPEYTYSEIHRNLFRDSQRENSDGTRAMGPGAAGKFLNGNFPKF